MAKSKMKPFGVHTRYVLRTCSADLKAYGGFQWPSSGPVECPDWSEEPVCGQGLHGFLDGHGSAGLADWTPTAKWLVVAVDGRDLVDFGDKVKFPRGVVLLAADRKAATDLMQQIRSPQAAGPVMGAVVSVGDRGTATAGYRGTATAGEHATATTGYGGTATAGGCGTATAGHDGTATAGVYGTATAGDRGTAAAGDHGTATAGVYGTAAAGDHGTAAAGDRGTATAGVCGIIRIRRWDGSRYRDVVGHIGENGLLPDTPYRLDAEGRFVSALEVK